LPTSSEVEGEREFLRVVLDTNVLVSAAIGIASPPGELVREWLDGQFTFVTSFPLLAELRNVIDRPHIARRTHPDPARRAQWVDDIAQNATLVHVSSDIRAVPSDPDDDIVIATAVAGRADYIVSGDRDLLSLERYRVSESHSIPILAPARFLALLTFER